MTRFFTADLHLGHRNIIDYCDRPFRDIAEMNEAIVDRWNEIVGGDDEVLILGDFALGKLADTLPMVELLAGRKVLLAGNHDRCWAGHKKGSEAATHRYLDAGFSEVWQGMVGLALQDHKVLACHFPYRGDSHSTDRYLDHRPVDKGAWLLHGHVHERWKERRRMINVGVDVWDFAPVRESALVEIMLGRTGAQRYFDERLADPESDSLVSRDVLPSGRQGRRLRPAADYAGRFNARQ